MGSEMCIRDSLNDNYRFWEERRDDEETQEQVRQVYDDVNAINSRMPRQLSDLLAAPHDVLPEAAWVELQHLLIAAHQTYGHIVLDALGPNGYSHDAWRAWLLDFGKANMAARRLMAEIG